MNWKCFIIGHNWSAWNRKVVGYGVPTFATVERKLVLVRQNALALVRTCYRCERKDMKRA